MQTRAPTPQDILSEWARNRHGTRRTPFVAGQCFGLTVNEDKSDACEFLPVASAPGSSAAGVVDRPSAPAATFQENE